MNGRWTRFEYPFIRRDTHFHWNTFRRIWYKTVFWTDFKTNQRCYTKLIVHVISNFSWDNSTELHFLNMKNERPNSLLQKIDKIVYSFFQRKLLIWGVFLIMQFHTWSDKQFSERDSCDVHLFELSFLLGNHFFLAPKRVPLCKRVVHYLYQHDLCFISVFKWQSTAKKEQKKLHI